MALEHLTNYSASLESDAVTAYHVDSVSALATLVRKQPASSHMLLRANGNSIHDQALTAETVLLLDGLPHEIRVELDSPLKHEADGSLVRWTSVRATAWTPWEAVVRAALGIDKAPAGWKGFWDVSGNAPPAGVGNVCTWSAAAPGRRFAHYVVPSSGRITVGGSLSADTMWRFSTLFGHQSRSVVWIDLLAYRRPLGGDRETYVLRLMNADAALWNESALHAENGVEFAKDQATNDEWFRAVTGGFGGLGPIIGSKHLVLELSATPWTSFALPTFPADPPPPPSPPAGTVDSRSPTPEENARLTAPGDDQGDQELRKWTAPPYPHADEGELGKVGATLPQQALTWMWVTRDPGRVFDDLVPHHFDHAKDPGDASMSLPRVVGPNTITHFALFFPNHGDGLKTVLGCVAFGKPPTPLPRPFKMWDRDYSRQNTPLVVFALPWFAGGGEELAFRGIFEPCIADTQKGSVCANPIPEFALFMEGHSVALDGMRANMPKTVQQTWVLPLPNDPQDASELATSRTLFIDFLTAVKDLSRQPWSPWSDAIRIQICDVKVLPKGHAILSSTALSPCIAITVAVEDGKDYGKNGWGLPSQKFEALTSQFLRRGVRLHLTKNRFASHADILKMYGAQIQRFKEIKHVLDPEDLYESGFSLDVIV